MHLIAGIDFDETSPHVARALIGTSLFFDGVGGTVVETEAYDQEDPASHSHGGERPRNASMFGPSGHAYVYRSYGLHWCLNFVGRPAGHGAGVLIRALAPTAGLEAMRERRGVADDRLLCAGPGRLAQALAVTGAHDGMPLDRSPFELRPAPARVSIVAGARIGLSKARDTPWRFGLAGSPHLSRRFV